MRDNSAPEQRCRLTPREAVWLWGIVLVAFVLRVGDTSWHPFGPDEGWTFELAKGSWRDLVAKTASDTHPPLHYALVKLLFMVLGADIYWGKLLSVVFATATLPLIFFVARIWYTPHAAWWALLFASFIPYHVYWSHVARNHLLLPFFTTGIILLSELLRERATPTRVFLMCIAWIGAIQTNYMIFVFGLVWGVAYILVEGMPWSRKRLLVACTIPGLVSYAPWYVVLKANATSSPMTIPMFQEFITPISLYYHAIFGGMTHLQPPQGGVWFLTTMAVFATMLLLGARAVGRRSALWIMLLGFSGVPIVIALIADFTLAERHLLYSLPLFYAYWGACCERAAALAAKRFG